jgi:hypothetical protein
VSGTATDDTRVLELARAGVERAAPEELPLFGPTSEAFLEDPASLEREGGGDRTLGFGVESALVLVTPAALSVARELVTYVTAQVRARLADEGEGVIQRTLDRIFGGRKPSAEPAEPAPPELSDEQLERVRAMALEKAKQLRLSDEKAELLADSLVGSLATG